MSEAQVDLSHPREIRTTRDFDAPRELVWKALTDPDHVDHWWGPDGFTNITEKNDFRPGGSWVFVMRGPDGTKYPNAITYREIVAPERLVYRQGTTEAENPDEDFNSVITLEDLGGKTRLTMVATLKDAAARDFVIREYGAAEGAMQHLEKLADHVERLAHVSPRSPLSPMSKSNTFVVTRSFDAPRELVWKAFTEPERMAQWWGPPGTSVGRYAMDLRAGGRYHFSLVLPDGGAMWGLFVYQEVSPFDRIVYHHSFSDESGNLGPSPFGGPWPARLHTTLQFADKGGKTEFTLRQYPIDASRDEEAAFSALFDGMNQGWAGTLDRLDNYLVDQRAS